MKLVYDEQKCTLKARQFSPSPFHLYQLNTGVATVTTHNSKNHKGSITIKQWTQLLSTYQPKCPQRCKVEKALVAMKYFRCVVSNRYVNIRGIHENKKRKKSRLSETLCAWKQVVQIVQQYAMNFRNSSILNQTSYRHINHIWLVFTRFRLTWTDCRTSWNSCEQNQKEHNMVQN